MKKSRKKFPKKSTNKSLNAYILLAILFLLALFIRLNTLINTPDTMRHGFGFFADSYIYHVSGFNLYNGHGFSRTDDGKPFGLPTKTKITRYEPLITRGPVYPFFVSMVYKFFGDTQAMKSFNTWHINWDRIRVVQCFLDTFTCLLVFFITRTISEGSLLPALISAGLYCFSFYNIYYTQMILSETVTTFLLTSALLGMILAIKHNQPPWWCLSGALFGLVILTRPEYMLLPAFLMISISFVYRDQFMKMAARSIFLLLAAIMIVIPWTIRNYYVSHQFIPVAVGGIGKNLFEGTFETNDYWQHSEELPAGAFDSPQEKTATQSLYTTATRALVIGDEKMIPLDHSLMKLALKRISDHPFECLRHWISKIPRLWYQCYTSPYLTKEPSGGWFIFYFLCALAAFYKGTTDTWRLMSPVVLIFTYLTLIFLPLHVIPRYGVALMPGIICLSSLGIWRIVKTALF